jgi:hypothetical protein
MGWPGCTKRRLNSNPPPPSRSVWSASSLLALSVGMWPFVRALFKIYEEEVVHCEATGGTGSEVSALLAACKEARGESISSFGGAVRYRVFFDVEADLGFGRKRRGFEQRTELLVNVAQGAVVEQ